MKSKRKFFFVSLCLSAASAMLAFYYGVFGEHRILIRTAFNQLPDWQTTDHSPALQAFQKSCDDILRQDPKKSLGNLAHSGKIADWQSICQSALTIKQYNQQDVLAFFENNFQPYRVVNNFHARGLFTGYYLPLVQASLQRTQQYSVPIYGMPNDLVQINLGSFASFLAGKTWVARLKNHVLIPYPDRRAIYAGALLHVAPVLAWASNPLDVFFAQVQGSALLKLPNQKMYLLNYAGDNGRKYTSIGKVLIAEHQLTKKNVSMQSIRAWLEQHPDQQQDILSRDASFVFFNLSPLSTPVGAEKIALTPERTLAVDTRYIPLGAPLWLATQVPKKNLSQLQMFHQLLIAQDSGGAVKGVVRGDVFWGTGEEAAFTAGHMQSSGQYWILLPYQKAG